MDEIEFTARDGRTYVIALSDDGEEISVQLDGARLGQISLRFVEGSDNDNHWYHITHLELDRCKGCGIGTRCLQFHVEVYGCTLTAGRNDGFSSEDGSHLTGDGPGFIAKMREKGIVSAEPEPWQDD